MRNARHIEVQVLGDGQAVASLGERECTLQRRFQKLVEIAPSPSLPAALRDAASRRPRCAWRARSATAGLGTFEFLVDARSRDPALRLHRGQPAAAGRAHRDRGGDRAATWCSCRSPSRPAATLGDARRRPPGSTAPQRGFAIQWRINAETLDAHGQARPAGGTLARFDLPSGPGVRVDTPRHRRPGALAALRHAAGQADRASRIRRLRRRAAALAARAGRVPHRGHRHQPGAAARDRPARPSSRGRRCTRAGSRRIWPTCWPRAAHLDDATKTASCSRNARGRCSRLFFGRRGRRRAAGARADAGPAGAVRGRGRRRCCRPARSSACSKP